MQDENVAINGLILKAKAENFTKKLETKTISVVKVGYVVSRSGTLSFLAL